MLPCNAHVINTTVVSFSCWIEGKYKYNHLDFCIREVALHEANYGIDLPLILWPWHTERDRVPVTKPALEMLCTTQTFKLAINHYGESCTQHLTLLHAAMSNMFTHLNVNSTLHVHMYVTEQNGSKHIHDCTGYTPNTVIYEVWMYEWGLWTISSSGKPSCVVGKYSIT